MSQSKDAYALGEPSAYTEETYQTDQYKAFTQSVVEQFRANGGKVGGTLQGLTSPAPDHHRRQVRPAPHHPSDLPDRRGLHRRHRLARRHALAPGLVSQPPRESECHRRGGEPFPARATLGEGAERQCLFAQIAAQMSPAFAEFIQNSHRELPVIILERVP